MSGIDCKNSLLVVSLERGPIWWQAATLTNRLSGVCSTSKFLRLNLKKKGKRHCCLSNQNFEQQYFNVKDIVCRQSNDNVP